MKKILLLLSTVALFCACDDNGGDDGGSGGNINYEEGYKYLKSLNVSDTKMIYQKSSSTRASGDDSYYKLDLSGNEVKLSIKGDDEQNHGIKIDKVLKLSDRILLVNPYAQDIVDLFYKPEPGDDNISVNNQSTRYLSIVDIQTEKLYRWPKNIEIGLYYGTLKTTLDNKGNVYFSSGMYEYHQIYKLNVSDFTMQAMLPDGQIFTDFNVTDNGFIMYWDKNSNNKNYKVKCPGGRIYPITGVSFIINNDLYSYKDKKVIKWEMIGNNELKETESCELGSDPDGNEYIISNAINNYARNTAVLIGGRGEWHEFDGKKCQLLDVPNDFYWHEYDENCLNTAKAWYIRDNTQFNKLNMKDYQESKFQVSDYEIQSITANRESSNITFTGFRYSDGANVVGTITESDKIVIDNVANNGSKIINLISLN